MNSLTDDRIRPKEAARLAHVSVGAVYAWMNQEPPAFKHFAVRKRGKERGIRFIDRLTFCEFLAKQREIVA